MLNDFHLIFKSKPILYILAFSAFVRFVIFFYLPSTPSQFGPDEGTYASLAKFISFGYSAKDFPNFGSALYFSSRTITLTNVLFIKIGFNELDATRLSSSLYGLASVISLSLIYAAIIRMQGSSPTINYQTFHKKSSFLIAVFAFFPSNFVWSIIGLRESGSQFWILTSFYFVVCSLITSRTKSAVYGIFFLISLVLAYGARPETAFIFSIVLFVFCLVLIIKNKRVFPLFLVMLAILLGSHYSTAPRESIVHTSSTSETSTTSETSSSLNRLGSQVSKIPELEYKRNVNSLNADSALPKSSCVNESKEILIIIRCNLEELPYRLFSFLFRPLPFVDQGSITLKYAALENLVWIMLIPMTLILIFRRHDCTMQKQLSMVLVTFVLVFSSAAALYEGNLGTAFRHKSSILWPIILVLMLTPFSTSTFTDQKTAKK